MIVEHTQECLQMFKKHGGKKFEEDNKNDWKSEV